KLWNWYLKLADVLAIITGYKLIKGIVIRVREPIQGMPDIPEKAPGLQHGGIVTKPMIGVIGEKGPEAVIPLNKISSVLPRVSLPPQITINVNAENLFADDFETVAEKMKPYYDELTRTGSRSRSRPGRIEI
ncbi:unnamed protein product, partial [marine sediment metagenome]